MTKTHASGAAQQYGMRYLLKAIFNVAVGEDDRDGNDPIEMVSEEQAANIEALITESGADREKFLAWGQAESVETLPAKHYKIYVDELERKRWASDA